MPLETFIIQIYVIVDDFLKEQAPLRKGGYPPKLTDAEVITMELVGEFMGCGKDKAIYRYFKTHWLTWFPKLGTRTTFTRQAANLWKVKELLRKHLVSQIAQDTDFFLSDGVPMPVCHPKRVSKRTPLKGVAAFGFCAAKDHYYFGFKGHVVTSARGFIIDYAITAANVDERDVLPEVVEGKQGHLVADKGLIRPALSQQLSVQGVTLHTPLRRNMADKRPKTLVKKLMSIRRTIETVIGQLAGRFSIQSMRAKDLWHLQAKVGRKILAHTMAFFLQGSLLFDHIIT